ncbi:MAG: hypothetical protein IKA49_00025 [Alistipes sp.]|nr:hypothetical protein [Alistipes sp.]
MNLKMVKFLLCCAMAMFVVACDNGEEFDSNKVNGNDQNGGGTEALYEKAGYNVMGTVTCNGVGVRNVVVSDGLKVTKTDASGRFWLKCELSFTPEVFISVPSGYETVDRKGTGMAFYAYTEKTDKVQTFHFKLKEVNQTNYVLFAFADSHVLGGASLWGSTDDVRLYNEVFIPSVRDYARRFISEGRRVYGVHCGDMTQCSAWGKYDMQDYADDTSAIEEFPIFNALGNHDHDHCNQANNKQEYTESNQQLSRISFRKAVGPGYYSFNIGSEHYVVLDNMLIKKHETDYTDAVDPLQLAWLKKDIQAMDKSKVKGVVVVMHSGYRGLNNQSEIANILKAYPQTYIIGHHHVDYTDISTSSEGKTVKEFRVPTLAGVAWLNTITTDGIPRCYNVFRFHNGEVTDRVFKTFDDEFKNNSRSYRVYDNSDNSGVDYPVHRYSGDKWKRSEEIALEEANASTLRDAAMINAWGAVSCEYMGADDVEIKSSGIYDLVYRDWYWPSLEDKGRNTIYYNSANPNGGNWQQPSKNITHYWRIVPKQSTFDSTAPVLIKDAQGKETRVTLRFR